ncbi:MoaA/NifB/PqqE/SkfB family radical SAM enzyme [Methanocalculus alkaliphilus]|uniref:radical SAM protein n=1 Tax=Methanocalculus alkaliphilus TaxID=768730 RepID=UPI0020A111DF|nr:radical SAM protein [Methanocalculus alkaliphilus]MCP1716098.1 MoaA/NifB/PqqE/SkfB family radical SAM enzyme [Methanocalculus alkaliphilus]
MTLIEELKILLSGLCEHPVPSVVDINLTTRCNQNCMYCEIGQGMLKPEREGKRFLNLHDIQWIIDQMKDGEIQSLILLGGEPFLFRDIFSVIEYASDKIQNISIITNGMQIPQLSIEELTILRLSNCKIIVSLDSFDAKTHNRIRGCPDAYEKAVQAIRILIDHQIPVQIETVMTHYNYHELSDIVKKAYSMGVSSVQFVPLITVSNFPSVNGIPEKYTLNPKLEHIERLSQEFDAILSFEEEHTIKTNIHDIKKWMGYYILFHTASTNESDFFFEYRLKRFFCWTIYTRIKINAYGEIQPCNLIPSHISIYTDPDEPLLHKWNRSCEEVRTAIKEQNYPRQCNGCYSSHTRNLLLSTMKYPFENRHTIPQIILEQIERMKKKSLG